MPVQSSSDRHPPIEGARWTGLLISTLCLTSSACDDDGSNAADDTIVEASSGGLATVDGEQVFFTESERATILTWLGPMPDAPPPDPSNAYADDPAAAVFGQKLFYDTGYSGDGNISCATCHAPDTGFDDGRANTSLGLAFTGRSAMTVFNGAFGAAAGGTPVWQFWDGRCDSQWSQALQPPESPAEMGSSRTTVALRLHDTYRDEYEAIFGAMPDLRDGDGQPLIPEMAVPADAAWQALPESVQDDVNRIYANFGKAIAAYERKLVSRDSRFDMFWRELSEGAPDSDILTLIEKEGLRAFIGTGRCLGCHGGPNFTDGQFHNIAVPQEGPNVATSDDGRATGLQRLFNDEFNCIGTYSDHPDKSQCAIASLDPGGGEMGAFKTPSLRHVTATAPYMHTGGFATLDDVMQHYDIGGGPTGTFAGTRDELMRPLALTPIERQGLVAFMQTLDGTPLDPVLMGPLR